jgi:hypothetical protein
LSVHNNGKGIKVIFSFTPLLPLPKPGSKRRKNAKAPIENRIIWLHEDQSLSQLLDDVIASVDQTDKLIYTVANRSGLVDGINFNVKYTIPRSDSKDIPLSYTSDFTALMDEVTGMKVASFKLFIFETKVCLLCTVILSFS